MAALSRSCRVQLALVLVTLCWAPGEQRGDVGCKIESRWPTSGGDLVFEVANFAATPHDALQAVRIALDRRLAMGRGCTAPSGADRPCTQFPAAAAPRLRCRCSHLAAPPPSPPLHTLPIHPSWPACRASCTFSDRTDCSGNPHSANADAFASPARNRRRLTEGRGGYGGKTPHSYGYTCYGQAAGCYSVGYA